MCLKQNGLFEIEGLDWSLITGDGKRFRLFDYENNQVREGYLVDALALRGDEGRGTLR